MVRGMKAVRHEGHKTGPRDKEKKACSQRERKLEQNWKKKTEDPRVEVERRERRRKKTEATIGEQTEKGSSVRGGENQGKRSALTNLTVSRSGALSVAT